MSASCCSRSTTSSTWSRPRCWLRSCLELAPRIRVIISSRTALRIRGEHTFIVEPLGLPGDDSETAVADSPAVQLFVQRATESNRKLEVDVVTSRTVAKICRALDGLPLAIELAASRSRSFSPAQIADQIATPLSIGEHSIRDLPARQQTLQATISWSYDLLTPRCAGGAAQRGRVPRRLHPARPGGGRGRTGRRGGRRAARGQPGPPSERRGSLRAARARARVRAGAAAAASEQRRRSGSGTAATSPRTSDRPARRSTTAARRVSSPLRCWPITPTSARHWRTRSSSPTSRRRSRWRSGCGRCGSPATLRREAQELADRVLDRLRRSPATSRSPCYERCRTSTTVRPHPAGIVDSPRSRPRSAIRRRSRSRPETCSDWPSTPVTATR